MGRVIDLASRRLGATDAEKFMLDLYETLTRTIDGTVGDPIADKLDLVGWHTDLEMVLWPDCNDFMDEKSDHEDEK
jgi:hypothetical protein